jgi:tubulin-folding cofactor B
MNQSVEELRRYVTAQDSVKRFGPTTLSLTISHSNLQQKWIEIRFDLSETIGGVKQRLYKHGGTPPEMQRLQLYDNRGVYIRDLIDDSATLVQYRVQTDYEIKIVDLDPHSLAKTGWLENTALVEKYVMPDEVYDARQGTVRKYKQQLAANASEEQDSSKIGAETAIEQEELDENFVVGRRCEIFPGGRRGEIKYVGKAESLGEGFWVGVALDEPTGKNDGTVKGKRFFACAPKHGVIVRPSNVKVGDFPPRSLSDDEQEMSDDEI